MGDDVTVLNSNIRDEPPMEEPPDHEDSPAYEEVKLTSTDPKTKVELTSTEPKTKFEQADNEEDPTNTQREGSLSKSADDKPAGEPQDTTVQPHNLIGDFAAAAASESPETEESKLLVTRATGSELEPVIPAPCSVLTEVFSSYHASDDEDFVSSDATAGEGKPSVSSHVHPKSPSDPESSGAEVSSQDSDSTDTDRSDSEDHHHGKSKPLKAQLLSNNPLIKRMEDLSARNLDLHDQQRLRRWVTFFLQHKISPSQLELFKDFFYDGHSLNDEIYMMQTDREYMGDFAFKCTSLLFSHPCKVYEEDKNGTLVLIGHYKIEVPAGAAVPKPFIFVKPYQVNHLMPALSASPVIEEDLEHAALWYREVNQSGSSTISPVETKTSDPEEPTLLVYGMLGDGNCYWHSWAFLLEILSHPWRPRDDALAHECLGIHRRSKQRSSDSLNWLNHFWRRQSPSRLVGSIGHAYGDSNISTIWKVLMAYHDVIGLHRLLVAFDYGCGKGQACFSIPMIVRDILSLQRSAGHEEVEGGVTSISMEQDFSVYRAATNVALALLQISLNGTRGREQFEDGQDKEPGCVTDTDTRIAVAFQNSFDLPVSELKKVDLVFGYDGSSMAAGSRSADHAAFVDKLLQAEIPFCMSSAGPTYVEEQPHYDAEKWMHFSIAGKQGKASCTMHLWISKTTQNIKHRVGTSEDQRKISQQEVRKRAQGEGEISKLILRALETAELPLEQVLDEEHFRSLWDTQVPGLTSEQHSDDDGDDNQDDSLESTKPPATQNIEAKMSPPNTRSKPPSISATFPRPGAQTKQKKKEFEGERREKITPSPATDVPQTTSTGKSKAQGSSSNKKMISEKRTTISKAAAAPEKSKETLGLTTVNKKPRKDQEKKTSVAKTADAGPASKKKQGTPKSTLKHTAMTTVNKKPRKEKKTPDSDTDSEKSKPTQTTVSKKSRKEKKTPASDTDSEKSKQPATGKSKKPSVAKTADAGPASKKKQETPKSTLFLKHTAMSSSDSDSEVPLDGNHNMVRRSQSRSASRSRSRSQGRKAMSKSRSRSASRSKGKTVTFKRVIDDNGNKSRNRSTSNSNLDSKEPGTSKSAKAQPTDSDTGPRRHGNSSSGPSESRTFSRSNSKVKEKGSTSKSKTAKTEAKNLTSEIAPRGDGKPEATTIVPAKSAVKKQISPSVGARSSKSEEPGTSDESIEKLLNSSLKVPNSNSRSNATPTGKGALVPQTSKRCSSSVKPLPESQTTSDRESEEVEDTADRNVSGGSTRFRHNNKYQPRNKPEPRTQLQPQPQQPSTFFGISQLAELSTSIVNNAVLPVLSVFHNQSSEAVNALCNQNRAGLHSISKTKYTATSSPKRHRGRERRRERGRGRERRRSRHDRRSIDRRRNRDNHTSPSDSSSSESSFSSYSDSYSNGSSRSLSYSSSDSRDRGSRGRRSKSRGRHGKDKHKRHKHRDGSGSSKTCGGAKRRRASDHRSRREKSHKGSRR